MAAASLGLSPRMSVSTCKRRSRALKRAMAEHNQQTVWSQANTFQVAQDLRIAVGHAAHSDRSAWWHVCQHHGFAFGQRAILPRDDVSMGIEIGVSQFLSDAMEWVSAKNHPQRNRGSAVTQVCSVFSQLLQLFSRGEFARAVKQHSAERHAKGFTCWGQFVAMLFCQVAQLKSLREVCMGLASCESPLRHLGLGETPKKSTLGYANEHRPWELYQTVFTQLLETCQAEVAARDGRKKFPSRTSWSAWTAALS